MWVRSDAVRKQLAGLEADAPASAGPGEGIYSAAWTERTYAVCLERARARLLEGERVVVDANFKFDAQRRPFVELARALGVPLRILVCKADDKAVRKRLSLRSGDASDADVGVYLRARSEWQPLAPAHAALADEVDTTGPREEVAERVLGLLRAAGLA